MPGQAVILSEGSFDSTVRNQLNANIAASPNIVASSQNSAFSYTGFGTAITLLAAGHAAGTYQVSVYAVITTTITTATSWLFALGFTDDKQAQTPTASTSSTMTAGAAEQATYTLRSTGATALTFTPTAASAGAGVIAYSVVVSRIL